ncbi:MAG: PilN domain-containing protein [Legionellaceae bacterium]|nr:PilN domain-containing protein [Legionellaceae bacterium]
MKQQIDFLKYLPSGPLQLPAKWITLASITSFALIVVISFSMALSQIDDYFVVKRIHADNTQLTILFQEAAKRYPLLASDTPLSIQVGALEKDLQDKKNEYATLTQSALHYGFSNYLDTLSKVVPDGLWLSDISINQKTKRASLSGYMTQPVDFSILLKSMQDSTTFAGTTFNVFTVKAISEKSYTAFNITNTTEDIFK